MNSITSLTQLLGQRSMRSACLGFAVALAGSATAQIAFVDEFDGDAIDTAVWATGVTGGYGSIGTFDGWAIFTSLALNPNDSTQLKDIRAGIVTHATHFNPFAEPFEVVYSDLFYDMAAPTVADKAPSVSFYSGIGRYAGDEGGPADGAKASSFGAGGGYPGALGFQVLRFFNDTWRLQVLDSGGPENEQGGRPGPTQIQVQLSGPPTKVVLGIDGTNTFFYVQIEGAEFTNLLVNNLKKKESVVLHSPTLVSGEFAQFEEQYITVSGTPISRISAGGYSATYGSDGDMSVELGSIEVRAYNPPEFPAVSIFAAYADEVDDGWQNTSVVAGTGMGWVYDAEYPYIWLHDAQGWFYVAEEGASASSFWAWNYNTSGWIWSSVDWNGWYWDHNTSTAMQF